MKKFIAIICFGLLFSLNVVAAFEAFDLHPPKEFSVYSENPKAVADIMEMTEEKLKIHIEQNNIDYLAVNSDNTKTIQLISEETDFSNSVSDLSLLSDSTIKNLIPDITGLKNINGEIIYHKDFKLVKINIREKNEGYILTQYFTVTEKKLYVLSFITEKDADLDYIDETFSPISGTEESDNTLKVIVICATVVFGGICLILIITIIKDLIFRKKDIDDAIEEIEDISDNPENSDKIE